MAYAVPILMYHSLDRDSVDRWTLSTSLFDEHMKWLFEHDYRTMTVSEFVAARRGAAAIAPRTVLITFDDGLRDFLTEAVPVLQRYGFTATLYVVTGLVGKTCHWSRALGVEREMLSWDELRSLSQYGIECGGHTHTHPQLDITPSAKALTEIRRSKVELEDHLGRSIESFAYPHGYASPETRRLVHDSGFTSACRVRHALSSMTEDPFALSRIIVTNDIPAHAFESLFTGDVLPIAPPTDRIIGTAWRLVRRFGQKLRYPSRDSLEECEDRMLARCHPASDDRS
jgi:O-antigen biosynthesis protein